MEVHSLLNPLDLGQVFVLATLFIWVREQSRAKGPLFAVLGGLAFAWVSAGAARTVHHWLGVPFVWDRLVDSVALQASAEEGRQTVATLGGIVADAVREALGRPDEHGATPLT